MLVIGLPQVKKSEINVLFPYKKALLQNFSNLSFLFLHFINSSGQAMKSPRLFL